MGEIKSTLELAMERTKGLAVSQKEKDEMKQKEALRKATSLFHRYREGPLSLNDVLKEIKRMEGKTATRVKEYLLSHWIDAFSLDDDNDRILKGVESLKGKSTAEVKRRFDPLLSRYQREKDEVKEKVAAQLAEALKRDKIWGSAVEPKLEGSELWKKENETLDRSYQVKLDEIKEQLRRL
jgi:hypothetical protein